MALLANIHVHERRAHPRHRVYKGVRAAFNANHSAVNCIMRDLSAGGARLSCAHPEQLPDSFNLIFLSEGEVRDVRVAWRSHDQLGVTFLSPPRKVPHLLR